MPAVEGADGQRALGVFSLWCWWGCCSGVLFEVLVMVQAHLARLMAACSLGC